MTMRSAECGVRNAEGKGGRRKANDLPLQFRIPHSAFRILLLLLLAGRAEAQIDPSGSWRTLHTSHFRIHFRETYRGVANVAAREAERAYDRLAAELRPPRQTVDVALVDDVDAANGATLVFPSSRIYLFLPPPATEPGLQHYDSWLRLVTTHELTHVFHLDRARGLWGTLQAVFGRVPGLFPNQYQPSWVIEGLATHYESKLTNAGRVKGSLHTQVLAADGVAGTSRGPWEAVFFTRWANGLVPYAYGGRFFDYLARAEGDSVVPRFVEATAGQLIPYRVGRQIHRVAPGRALQEEWPKGTRPLPEPGSPAAAARVLDGALRSPPVPRAAPDGRRIAYLRDDGKGARELRVIDAATSRVLRHHRVNAGVSYDWLGDTLVIAQLDWTSPWQARSDLYRWLPGGEWRRVTHGARLVEPRAGGGRLSAIALVPAGNRPLIPVPREPAQATWGAVAPSPDGRTIAATRHANGHWALVRWPADSPEAAVVLRASRGVITDPVWTPAGELLFVADATRFPQVYRWRDSAGAEPLTAEPLGARAPAPLPDGTLLYATLSARGWELRHASADSAGAAIAADVPPPLEPAPAAPVRETGYALWPSLRPHFWVPLFFDAGPTGRFFGGATAGTDVVGRFVYVATGLIAPEPFRGMASFAGAWTGLGNPVVDWAAASTWDDVRAGVKLSERTGDAAAGVSFVARRWRTFASVRFAGEFEGTRFATIPDTALADVCPACENRDEVGGSVTLALSHVVTAPLAVSPENGFVWSATYRRREEQGSARFSNEVRSRLNLYARIPGLGGYAHHVLAVRVAAGATAGPLGEVLKVGGVSSGSLGLTFGQSLGTTRSFPVRGYGGNELRGRRAATATLEYRLPLVLIGRPLGHLPFGADRLWLNAFSDVGDAWAPGAEPRLTRLASAGVELAGDLTVNYDFLLQVRLGLAQPLVDPPSGSARRAQIYLGFASDF
ncbi:MAG TPA: hypothetical protein VFU41_13155 [Gemmatimonadales bacterium]|nr:hypothetical protein [Gemmatimonadales bacterium]